MKEIFTDEVIAAIIKLIAVILSSVITVGITKLVKTITKKVDLDTELNVLNEITCYIRDVVYNCVEATNQTFVDDLKAEGIFTLEKQEEAFKKTYDMVYSIVHGALRVVVKDAVEDSDEQYLKSIIEQTVKSINDSKKTSLGEPLTVLKSELEETTKL